MVAPPPPPNLKVAPRSLVSVVIVVHRCMSESLKQTLLPTE